MLAAPFRDAFGAKKDEDGEEDEAEASPFFGIEKGAVLQESRVFHEQQLDARHCAQVITKLLYLINQGEHFTKTEATEVFFAVTKLFQSKDINLRRMVYLIIKELSPSADEVRGGARCRLCCGRQERSQQRLLAWRRSSS
eukprot:scaffold950_cov340-Prasinococcus_capsulatus_cf.AAC.2